MGVPELSSEGTTVTYPMNMRLEYFFDFLIYENHDESLRALSTQRTQTRDARTGNVEQLVRLS